MTLFGKNTRVRLNIPGGVQELEQEKIILVGELIISLPIKWKWFRMLEFVVMWMAVIIVLFRLLLPFELSKT